MGASEWKRTAGNKEQMRKGRPGGPGGKQETGKDWGQKKREMEGDGKDGAGGGGGGEGRGGEN